MGSAAPTIKAALFSALQAAYTAPVQVCYGHPGTDLENDIVSVGNVRSVQDVATMSSSRAREEVLEIDVTVSCYAGGGTEAQQPVTERAYVLAATLEDYLKGSGYSIGGTCRLARVVSHDLAESEDPEILALGRVAELTVTVEAVTRI